MGVQRGEEKKKCPEAKVRCRPCESEWRGGLPKSPKKNFRKKRKGKKRKNGGPPLLFGRVSKNGGGGGRQELGGSPTWEERMRGKWGGK